MPPTSALSESTKPAHLGHVAGHSFPMGQLDWGQDLKKNLKNIPIVQVRGRIARVAGTLVEASMPPVRVGELCRLELGAGRVSLAEVVGFNESHALLAALEPLEGVASGGEVQALGCLHQIRVSDDLLGNILDGFGRPLADRGQNPATQDSTFKYRHTGYIGAMVDPTTNALDTQLLLDDSDLTLNRNVIASGEQAINRPPIDYPCWTGVRAIDGLLTLGIGQRVGLFAGPGCGKTTLMSAIARGVEADVIVFALVGERGRELREFLERELDDTLRQRTVVVCATSDCTAMERARAAFTATAIAEAFCEQGKRVVLMIDSLTRFARAQREIGLSAGEPPTRNGYPPSVFAALPRLIERAGNTPHGSITAIYTVLVEGESMTDPIADEARSLLDGHIVLSRKLAERAHFPAIDILGSLSRVMSHVTEEPHMLLARKMRTLMARHADVELLIRLNEYQVGNEPFTDFAVNNKLAFDSFLQQSKHEQDNPAQTRRQLSQLLQECPEDG